MGNLTIIDTTLTSITIGALVNLTNPTNYSATVPYVNINVLINDTIVGQAIGEDITVHPGNNTNIAVKIVWDPFTHSGDKGRAIGSEFLSKYVSGMPPISTLPYLPLTYLHPRLQYIPYPTNPQRHHTRPTRHRLCSLPTAHHLPHTSHPHTKEARR